MQIFIYLLLVSTNRCEGTQLDEFSDKKYPSRHTKKWPVPKKETGLLEIYVICDNRVQTSGKIS